MFIDNAINVVSSTIDYRVVQGLGRAGQAQSLKTILFIYFLNKFIIIPNKILIFLNKSFGLGQWAEILGMNPKKSGQPGLIFLHLIHFKYF